MNLQLRYVLYGCLAAIVIALVILFLNDHTQSKSKVVIKDSVTKISLNELLIEPRLTAGKKLFETNCMACHSLFKVDSDMHLLNAIRNITDKKFLHAVIKNTPQLYRSGNSRVDSMYKEYQVMMPSFEHLTDAQIDNILEYIKAVSDYRDN